MSTRFFCLYYNNLSCFINSMACKSPRNPLTKFCKQNELGKLSEDQCYIETRNTYSTKPFQWNTYHHHPYGCNVEAVCQPAQFYWDGYGLGGCNIDGDSKLNRNPGYHSTNLNVHQELPTLPINMPQIKGYHDADTESNLRFEANFNKKQCTGVTEQSFIDKTFQVFDSLAFDPQEIDFIVPELTFNKCYKNAKYWHRAGEPSRFDRQQKYRNGCDWKEKYFSKNLSFSTFGY